MGCDIMLVNSGIVGTGSAAALVLSQWYGGARHLCRILVVNSTLYAINALQRSPAIPSLLPQIQRPILKARIAAISKFLFRKLVLLAICPIRWGLENISASSIEIKG